MNHTTPDLGFRPLILLRENPHCTATCENSCCFAHSNTIYIAYPTQFVSTSASLLSLQTAGLSHSFHLCFRTPQPSHFQALTLLFQAIYAHIPLPMTLPHPLNSHTPTLLTQNPCSPPTRCTAFPSNSPTHQLLNSLSPRFKITTTPLAPQPQFSIHQPCPTDPSRKILPQTWPRSLLSPQLYNASPAFLALDPVPHLKPILCHSNSFLITSPILRQLSPISFSKANSHSNSLTTHTNYNYSNPLPANVTHHALFTLPQISPPFNSPDMSHLHNGLGLPASTNNSKFPTLSTGHPMFPTFQSLHLNSLPPQYPSPQISILQDGDIEANPGPTTIQTIRKHLPPNTSTQQTNIFTRKL